MVPRVIPICEYLFLNIINYYLVVKTPIVPDFNLLEKSSEDLSGGILGELDKWVDSGNAKVEVVVEDDSSENVVAHGPGWANVLEIE